MSAGKRKRPGATSRPGARLRGLRALRHTLGRLPLCALVREAAPLFENRDVHSGDCPGSRARLCDVAGSATYGHPNAAHDRGAQPYTRSRVALFPAEEVAAVSTNVIKLPRRGLRERRRGRSFRATPSSGFAKTER